MTEVFYLHVAWKAIVDGIVIPAEFNSRGAASAAIDVERRRRANREATHG